MGEFPRTIVGGVSMPRMIIGSNWFLGWSHTSLAKDKFIKTYQDRDNVAEILTVFLEAGIDAVITGGNDTINIYCTAAPLSPLLCHHK